MTTRSSNTSIPTETFLLPGQQQFCVQPWEIARLPRGQVPLRLPPAPRPGNALDDSNLRADPFEGLEIGACQVIRRLSPGSVKMLLALREDPQEGAALAVLQRIDLPEANAREIAEHAQSARRFRHPNLGRIFDCEVADEGIFWVSEYTSGATLAELAAACTKLGKGLPVGLALGVIYEAALALGELHVPTAFSHGLISDQSVAISFDGTARLQDVGLFKCIARQNSWVEVLASIGPYLAPEQILKGYPPDPKCDVYSLAAVLYESLSGQKLARASNYDDRVKKHLNSNFVPPSSLNVSLGKQLDEVVGKALNADRSKRYPTSLEFAKELKQAASAFMWRAELRAEFVGKLFEVRKRHEQVLLAGCAPKRSLTSPALAMPAIVPPPPPSPFRIVVGVPIDVAPAAVPHLTAKLKRAKAAPRRHRKDTRPLGLTLLASALAWVAWGGVVPPDLDRVARDFLVPPPPAFVVEFAPPAPEPPPPASAVTSLACIEEPSAPATTGAEVAKPAAKPSPRAVKRKHVVDALPSAPWLTPRGRKNH